MESYRETLSTELPEFQIRTQIRSGKLPSSESHWHEEMEIVYVRRGSGIQRINQAIFALEPGQISIILPNQVHSFIPMSDNEDFDILVLQFNLRQLLENEAGEKQFCSSWLDGCMIFDRALKADDFLAKLIEIVHTELKNRETGFIYSIKGAVYLLLAQLLKREHSILPADSAAQSGVRQRDLLEPAISFLTENYKRDDLSVREAADTAGLSVTHFSRLFKQATGMGFHEYLNRYRIIQAEHQFNSGQSLLEIACDCGFGSASSFLRNYKNYRGTTPRQARKLYSEI